VVRDANAGNVNNKGLTPENIILQKVDEDTQVYTEIDNYDYIGDESTWSPGFSHSKSINLQNERSHKDLHNNKEAKRDDLFPYENVLETTKGHDNLGYENFL
jgi:hypothetical protein